jgi:predicted phage terminase large subunit-like protein
VIEQEPGSAGKKVVAYIRDVLLPDFHVRGVSATGSKVARARPVAGQVEAGNVRLLRGAWNSAFLDEVSSFGEKCLHDDQVDALAGAYNALQTAGAVPRVATFGR